MSAGLSGNNTGTTQQFSGEESAEFMVMQPDAWFSFIFPTFTALCCLNSQPRVTLYKLTLCALSQHTEETGDFSSPPATGFL